MKYSAIAVAAMAACLLWIIVSPALVTLPPIEEHHWKRNAFGAELYNESGEETASIVGSQVCIFQPLEGCHTFESEKLAVAYVVRFYEIHQ